jgi:signal transduction histidine kinase
MAEQLSTAQEDERRRIARELHDEMGQNLTAVCFELNLLRAELGAAVPQQRVDAIAALLRETTDTMRRAVADLRPPILDDFGFRAAVENELSALQRRSGISYEAELPEEEPPLDGARATALFRIIQESLTNVARHSAATHVHVSVTVGGGQVILEVTDNGRGITAGEAAQTESLGLTGVRERVWAFGGDVSIEGTPGSGTRIRVRFPCKEQWLSSGPK